MPTYSIPEWSFPIHELPPEVAAAWTERESMGWIGLTFEETLDLFFHVESLSVNTRARARMVVHEGTWIEADPDATPEGGFYDIAIREVWTEPLVEAFALSAVSGTLEEGVFSQPDWQRSFTGSNAESESASRLETMTVTFGVHHEHNDYNVLVLGTWDSEDGWTDMDFYIAAPNRIIFTGGKYWFLVGASLGFEVNGDAYMPRLDHVHEHGPYHHNVGPIAYDIFPSSGIASDTSIYSNPDSRETYVAVNFLGKTIRMSISGGVPAEFPSGGPIVGPGACFEHDPHDGAGPIWTKRVDMIPAAEFFGAIVPTMIGDTLTPPARAKRSPFSWQP